MQSIDGTRCFSEEVRQICARLEPGAYENTFALSLYRALFRAILLHLLGGCSIDRCEWLSANRVLA